MLSNNRVPRRWITPGKTNKRYSTCSCLKRIPECRHAYYKFNSRVLKAWNHAKVLQPIIKLFIWPLSANKRQNLTWSFQISRPKSSEGSLQSGCLKISPPCSQSQWAVCNKLRFMESIKEFRRQYSTFVVALGFCCQFHVKSSSLHKSLPGVTFGQSFFLCIYWFVPRTDLSLSSEGEQKLS